MFEQLMELAKSNPQVAGALTLVIGGAVSWIARDIPMRVWNFIVSQSIVQLEMDNASDWNGVNPRMSSFQAWYVENGATWMSRSLRMTQDGSIECGPGTHYFVWKYRLFWFHIEELQSSGVHFRKRVLRLHCLSRSEKLMKEFVEEITSPPECEKTTVETYLMVRDHDQNDFRWKEAASQPIIRNLRPLVRREVFEQVAETINRYESDAAWFEDNYMTYKRTFFFWGPPGTGKSTLAVQIAMMTGRDIFVVDTGSVTDQEFAIMMASIPGGSLILFEDIHSNGPFKIPVWLTNNDGVRYQTIDRGSLSLSPFLNALNGVIPLNNQIVVMTTNYKEQLDPAIYRPGRVDLDLEVGFLESGDIQDWLVRVFGDVINQKYGTLKFPPDIPTGAVFKLYERHREDYETLIRELQAYAPLKLVEQETQVA